VAKNISEEKVFILVRPELVLEPDHICRRQMSRRCGPWLDSWLGWRGHYGGGRGGVFAVGVPGEAVVVGMKRYW
jgi:hypothetical protein